MKKFSIIALTLLAFTGCQVEELVQVTEQSPLEAEMINYYIGVESDLETRTSTDSELNILWSEGDQMNFFCGINNDKKDKFTLVEGAGTKYGTFTGKYYVVPEDQVASLHQSVLVYPYSDATTCVKTEDGFTIGGVVVPAVQKYTENSFANGAHPMVGVAKNTNEIAFGVKNTNAALKLSLTGTKKIAKIVVSSDKYIAGDATIAASYGTDPVLTIDPETGSKVIELICDGIQLKEDEATVFYVTFAPCEGAVTLNIYDTEGGYLRGKYNAKDGSFDRNEHVTAEFAYAPNGSIQNDIRNVFTKGGSYVLPMDVTYPDHLYQYDDVTLDLGGNTLSFSQNAKPCIQVRNKNLKLDISNGAVYGSKHSFIETYSGDASITVSNVKYTRVGGDGGAPTFKINQKSTAVFTNLDVKPTSATHKDLCIFELSNVAGVTIDGGKYKVNENQKIFKAAKAENIIFNGDCLFSDKSFEGVEWLETGDENYPWKPGESVIYPVYLNGVGYDKIQDAIDASVGGEVITIADGTYPEVLKVTGGKNLTIQPQEGAKVTIGGVDHQSNGTASTVVFNDITFDNSIQTAGWFTGTAQNLNVCVGAWGGNLSFNDCTFNVAGTSGAETGVMTWWTTEKGSLSFNECTFNGIENHASARAMQIYGNMDLTVSQCTFNTPYRYSLKYVGEETTAVLAQNTVNNAQYMVELGSSAYPGNAYEVTISGSVLGEGIKDFKVANIEEQIVNGVEYSNKAASVNGTKYETVGEALDAAAETATKENPVEVAVKAGKYTFPSNNLKEGVILNCEDGTVFEGGSSLNVNGATVINAEFSNPTGSAVTSTINGTFKDCVFEGSNALRWCNAGETVVFEDCVFSGDVYGVHFDGGSNDAIFRRCTFSGFNAFGSALTQLTLEDCTFKSNGKSGYNGANLWGSTTIKNTKFIFDGSASYEWIDCIGSDKTYVIENCVVEGPVNGIFNKEYISSRNDETDITINGVLYEDYMVNTISTVEELKAFAVSVNENNNSFSGKTVFLTADIDLNNDVWTPIGQTGSTTFNGVFDGQNHTISNLKVDSEAQTGAYYSSGLFGWVESHTAGHGHIKNVKIDGATIVGHHNCGALVGYITQETALVENCHVSNATISCTKANDDANGDKAGALIGNATISTPVIKCTAAKSTVSAGRDAGQVIGVGREANVTECSASEVTVSANGTSTGNNVRNEVIGRLL